MCRWELIKTELETFTGEGVGHSLLDVKGCSYFSLTCSE